eukprot:TRINITY_DN4281_c0_g1_i6.p1 TRINITY_DN4281_c0_g1~~TRINITY_DN4281_c0_g1_i6.p1  ORF type:complete len:134 (-),score=22.01 TRINITY_DN4281_c0_g1_i6:259-633(-)
MTHMSYLQTDKNVGTYKWLLLLRFIQQLSSSKECITYDNRDSVSLDTLLAPIRSLKDIIDFSDQSDKTNTEDYITRNETKQYEQMIKKKDSEIQQKQLEIAERDARIYELETKISELMNQQRFP